MRPKPRLDKLIVFAVNQHAGHSLSNRCPVG